MTADNSSPQSFDGLALQKSVFPVHAVIAGLLAAFVGYALSWYIGLIEGNFALLLLLATVVTGIYWLAERFYFLPRRREAAARLEAEAAARRPVARPTRLRPMTETELLANLYPDDGYRAVVVDNYDIYVKTDPSIPVPAAYSNVSLDNNDGLVIIESNDYNRDLGGGNVQVGYQVGCQVNVGGIDVGLTGGLYLPLSTNTTASPLPIIGGSLNFPVQPGQVVVVKVLNKDFKKKVVSLQLSGVEMTVQSCGGYAQARSFITVLATDNYSTEGGTVTGNSGAIQTTLYGTPFSLG